jgi:hypothetical protein
MALAQTTSILPSAEERRRFQRVKVHLLGRYMLPDRREFPCQVINMSPATASSPISTISAASRARSRASSTTALP